MHSSIHSLGHDTQKLRWSSFRGFYNLFGVKIHLLTGQPSALSQENKGVTSGQLWMSWSGSVRAPTRTWILPGEMWTWLCTDAPHPTWWSWEVLPRRMGETASRLEAVLLARCVNKVVSKGCEYLCAQYILYMFLLFSINLQIFQTYWFTLSCLVFLCVEFWGENDCNPSGIRLWHNKNSLWMQSLFAYSGFFSFF